MLFDTAAFACFFPIVVFLHLRLTPGRRWALLLAASCFFYMYFVPAYIFILGALIAVDYLAGIYIEERRGGARRAGLLVSILATCLILATFKYARFFGTSGLASLALPLGLSFHTMQSLGYVIEVYRGRQKAERHLGRYALYVMFFPQLIAGPIERPQSLLPQIREPREPDSEGVSRGVLTMAIGLLLKVVVADRLAPLVNEAYASPASFSGFDLLLATFFYAFQVYCDFAGYSLLAIGSADVLGFRLTPNFRRPYLAASVGEFWRRWNVTLSFWMRDYVYIPLGGNRAGRVRGGINLIAAFLLSALWHGANWTYVAWGALSATYLIVEKAAARAGGLGPAWLGRARTFALVCLALILIRARNIADASLVFFRIMRRSPAPVSGFGLLGRPETATGLILIFGLVAFESVQERTDLGNWLSSRGRAFRWTFYYALALTLLCFGAYGNDKFIYSQF